jgi:3'-phosphoadenosine 5'-phosphosulfate sulfotransferase (PAPS reductase)/FAD synthetase
VRPLRKILSTLKAWITGVRKDQSVTRVDVPFVLIDDNFKGLNNSNLIKFNPLSEVTSQEVW